MLIQQTSTLPSGPLTASADELEYKHRLARALGDDYELRDLIGRGGFGAVYGAWDKRLERSVAVKALRHDVFPTAALVQRFDREAKAVAKLRHPNILPIFAVGEGNGIAYMVMPLIEGESLRAYIERVGSVATEEAVRIMSEAAAALEAAHKLGIIHRDVKPANIMLEGPERRVLLMDFGIAKATAVDDVVITGTGMIVGSPAYMSPEQARGEKDIDGRSDIYSLGSVAFEMVTGRLPFVASNLHELVYKQVTQDIPDVARLVSSLNAGVARAIMRCLAKEAEGRWQTASDFRTSLSAGQATTPGPDRANEGESWVSARGPYVLLLGLLFYVVKHLREVIFGPEIDRHLVPFASYSVLVLLGATVADMGFHIAIRMSRGQSSREIIRYLVGQPDWWPTWYPRPLRVPDSVWDRLPFVVKLVRTLVWVSLIVVPAGSVLSLFVVPTLRNLTAGMSGVFPMLMRAFTPVVQAAQVMAVFTAVLLWRQVRYWRREHGVPPLAFLASLFNLRGGYWQGSPARVMLKD